MALTSIASKHEESGKKITNLSKDRLSVFARACVYVGVCMCMNSCLHECFESSVIVKENLCLQ